MTNENDIYWDGKAVNRDPAYALECHEKTASYGKNIEKGVEYLKAAVAVWR